MRTGDIVKCTQTQKDGVIFNITEEKVSVRWMNGTITEYSDEYDLEDSNVEIATPKLYVNVYVMTREYGGPEEGGWYYDAWYPTTEDDDLISKKYNTVEEAEAAYKIMVENVKEENATRYPLHSVLSDGIYEVRLEAYEAEVYPRYRPQYC